MGSIAYDQNTNQYYYARYEDIPVPVCAPDPTQPCNDSVGCQVVPRTLLDIVALAAGVVHVCALRADGTVQCWGDGGYAQLGNGSTRACVPTAVCASGALPCATTQLSGLAQRSCDVTHVGVQ